MDRIYKFLSDKKLEPFELLPVITVWITEKGSAQQLIDWINGLEREKTSIFAALGAVDSVEDVQEDQLASGGTEGGGAEGIVPIKIQAQFESQTRAQKSNL